VRLSVLCGLWLLDNHKRKYWQRLAESSFGCGKVVSHPNPGKNGWALGNNRRRRGRGQSDRISAIEEIFSGKIADEPSPKLTSGIKVCDVVVIEFKRVQVVIELSARVAAFNTEHDARRLPVPRFPCELVPWHPKNVQSNQRRIRIDDRSVCVLISTNNLDGAADPERTVQFSPKRAGSAKVLTLTGSAAQSHVRYRIDDVTPKQSCTSL
jgi:hypothetical protein